MLFGGITRKRNQQGESLIFIFVTEALAFLTLASRNTGIIPEMFYSSEKDSGM